MGRLRGTEIVSHEYRNQRCCAGLGFPRPVTCTHPPAPVCQGGWVRWRPGDSRFTKDTDHLSPFFGAREPGGVLVAEYNDNEANTGGAR